ncbi:nicotinate phosphoribosyltransferase [Leifsonia sp. Leaf264]|uniref:nicotinate phosphoribosyltransferase n=1 Tax=Leifsonia sp. Leaf264 TaxID=1736314 RepID=UPI0006F764A0|nr:nicotinate phosphoribosyltransferase [Leifsonia sp. Leaf264]KQO98156.1 nicotinate phosphoribosyltransferase [Leifsonia sp. Leaf264]
MTNTIQTIAPRITAPTPIAALMAADGYKLDHLRAYGPGVTQILINWTNRSNHHLPEAQHAVAFGLQAFCQSYLTEAWAPFFAADEDFVASEYERVLTGYLGPNEIGSAHVRALHQLGYLPLIIRAVPEGTLLPFGVAALTIENTLPEFFWLPNYIETALSASIWHPATTATISVLFRELFEAWAERTGGDLTAIDFQAHDFSMRGQTSITSAAASGAGHLLSFLGTDSLPSIDFIDRFYPGDNGWVAASVPATEHSVMCLRGQDGELETFDRLLDLYPTGIVSAVSDGYDFFGVLTEILPQLKDKIMARDGKLVIRPDSGDPVDIITGEVNFMDEEPQNRNAALATYEQAKATGTVTNEQKGAIEILGDLFGYTINAKGFKELDSHIGLIYGDSITLDRAQRIFERLEAKGWASTNVVLGIGSFTFQYQTRDSLGSAVKATWAEVDSKPVDIQKDPKTGGGKKSAKGRLALTRDESGEIVMIQQATPEDEANSLLQPVWVDGGFVTIQSFADVRATLKAERAARAARNAA